jgi:molecular chaperone DnaJ
VNNPYEVLGLKEGATKEEIKKSYRELVKRYHPDKHQDNPLGDLAEEKMREINAAYDELMNGNASSGSYGSASSGGSSYGQTNSYSTSGGSAQNNDIRRDINNGDLRTAETKLRNQTVKDAEWYFLYGAINQRKGFYNEAFQGFQMAAQMSPGNMEYRNAYSQLSNQAGMYQRGAYGGGYGGAQNDACCQLCAGMAILDCLCDSC